MKILSRRNVRSAMGVAAVAVTAALVLTGCGGGSTPGTGSDASGPVANLDSAEWDALVAQAEEEGQVDVYWSMGKEEVMATLIGDFKKEYPGVNVNIVFAATGDLVNRLSEEIEASAAGADIAIHASPVWFEQYNEAGAFAAVELSPDNQETGWEARFDDKSFTTWWGFQYVLGYNTSQTAPTDVEELLDSNPDARIGIVDPHASAAAAFTYETLRETYGDEILDKLADARYTIYANNSNLSAGFGAGEVDFAYPDQVNTTRPLIEAGAPLDQVITQKAQAGASYNVAAIKTAPHPAAAQVFLNYLLGETGQEAVATDASPSATVPLDVEGAIPWGSVAFQDPDDWTTEKWNAWIAEYWTPRFG